MDASRNLEGGIHLTSVMLFFGERKKPSLNIHSDWALKVILAGEEFGSKGIANYGMISILS